MVKRPKLTFEFMHSFVSPFITFLFTNDSPTISFSDTKSVVYYFTTFFVLDDGQRLLVHCNVRTLF